MIPSRSPSTDSSFVDVSPPLPVLPPEPTVAGLELGNCRTSSPASELPGSHPEPSAAGLTPPTVSTAHPCSTTTVDMRLHVPGGLQASNVTSRACDMLLDLSAAMEDASAPLD